MMKPSLRNILTLSIRVIFLISLMATWVCKKNIADEDLQDCDKIYNYYEGGAHYIRRDLVKDDGVVDYEKLLDESQIKRSDCYPAKDIELDATIGD